MRNTWLSQVLKALLPRLCKESCSHHFSSKTQSSLKLPPKRQLLSQCRSTSLQEACKVWGTILQPKSCAGKGWRMPEVQLPAHAQVGVPSSPGRRKAGGWLLMASGEGLKALLLDLSPKPANVQGQSHGNALLHCIAPRPVPPDSSVVSRIHLRRPPLSVLGAFPLKYRLRSVHRTTYPYFFPSFTENS